MVNAKEYQLAKNGIGFIVNRLRYGKISGVSKNGRVVAYVKNPDRFNDHTVITAFKDGKFLKETKIMEYGDKTEYRCIYPDLHPTKNFNSSSVTEINRNSEGKNISARIQKTYYEKKNAEGCSSPVSCSYSTSILENGNIYVETPNPYMSSPNIANIYSSGKPAKIVEHKFGYRTVAEFDEWMEKLLQEWKRDGVNPLEGIRPEFVPKESRYYEYFQKLAAGWIG